MGDQQLYQCGDCADGACGDCTGEDGCNCDHANGPVRQVRELERLRYLLDDVRAGYRLALEVADHASPFAMVGGQDWWSLVVALAVPGSNALVAMDSRLYDELLESDARGGFATGRGTVR